MLDVLVRDQIASCRAGENVLVKCEAGSAMDGSCAEPDTELK